ncbi:MAG: biopolymer transporter ExbD [Sphingomonadales bacterium]|nr:MAG: biopolymer transporter ExbD [Sphingomonadales bacterium]
MAQRRISEESSDGSVDLTPMLDVVFIMLIFFIVTAVFIREPGPEVLRPEAETDVQQSRIAVLIAVTEDDEVYIDQRQIDPNAVRAIVERMRAENPQGSVVIQADEESRSGVFVDVIDQVRQAGAPSIAVATRND